MKRNSPRRRTARSPVLFRTPRPSGYGNLALHSLEHVADAVFVLGSSGGIVYCNRAAVRLLRISSWPLGHVDEHVVLHADDHAGAPRLDVGSRMGSRWQLPPSAVLIRADGSLVAVEGEYMPASTLGRGLLVLRDVSEQRRARRWMAFQASHDGLTTLLNRAEIERRIAEALEFSAAKPSALLYIDLDQFKIINDTSGHHAGDEFLRLAGKVLRRELGPHHPVARLGGDEFVVLLSGEAARQAAATAERLIDAIRAIRFVWEERVFRISASVGIVLLDRRFSDWRQVLSLADSACFMAKEQGRARVWIAREGDDLLRRRQLQMDWVARITGALERDQFQIYRQKIAPLDATRGTRHWEVLTRLREADGACARPEQFIPAAERYGLMPQIDRWVVNSVLSHLAGLPTEHPDRTAFTAINLSGTTLSDPEFVRFVASSFARYGVAPHRICFEITETAAATDFDAAMRFIAAVRSMGCRIALDDFGSGISSFTYLKAFNVDYLKIDGCFVRDMDTDHVNARFVESINHLGKSLGLVTIAEYAESAPVVERLRSLGVDYAQGNFLGRPEQWLA